jgi:hypothetical protein
MGEGSAYRWRCATASVKGASHGRSGLPNQDHVGWREVGESTILCLSDGHGGARYFRSHLGSAFAVEAGLAVLERFLKEAEGLREGARGWLLIEKEIEEKLPRDIVKDWGERVSGHLAGNQFTAEELARVKEREGEGGFQKSEADGRTAYGATFLAVVVAPELIFCLQNGDGDILVIDEDRVARWILPADQRLIANETTSLCEKDAWKDFRTGFQRLAQQAPPLILASTDGYINSFSSAEGFLQVGSDVLDMARAEGFDYVEKHLEQWLEESSERGSGDDISAGLLYRDSLSIAEVVHGAAEQAMAIELKEGRPEEGRLADKERNDESASYEGRQGLHRGREVVHHRRFHWRWWTGRSLFGKP